jgi:hypothetical protein
MPTTTIDAPEKTPKSGKRARKPGSPQKIVPVRTNGKQRPAGAKGAILYPIAGLRDAEPGIK